MEIKLILALILIPVSLAKVRPFPEEFPKCRKDDPAINECVRDAVQKAIPFLARGMPKYGIVPVDPLVTPEIVMSQSHSFVPINLTFNDLKTSGNRNTQVLRAEVDVDKPSFTFYLFFPKVHLNGNYKAEAKVFLFPVEGEGPFEITLEGISTKIGLEGVIETRAGNPHLKITKAPIDITIQKLSVDFKNLFNKDGRLGRNINWFLNRFADRIFKELKPLVDDTQGELTIRLAQPFFDRVPISEFFE